MLDSYGPAQQEPEMGAPNDCDAARNKPVESGTPMELNSQSSWPSGSPRCKGKETIT